MLQPNRLTRCIICFAVLSLAACTAVRPQLSGFIDGYDRLNPSPELDDSLVWYNPSKSLSLYKMISLDPVQVIVSKQAETAPDETSMKQLAQSLEEQLRAVMGQSYPMVDHGGFGVMRARVAITNVNPDKSPLGLSSPKSMFGLDLQNAFLEVEMLDTQSGERVMALVNLHQGGDYRKPAGAKLFRDPRDILRSWAVLLRDSLDQTRGLHRTDSFHSTFGVY